MPVPSGESATTAPRATGAETHHGADGVDDAPEPVAPQVGTGTTPTPSATTGDDRGTDDSSHDSGSSTEAGHDHDDD